MLYKLRIFLALSTKELANHLKIVALKKALKKGEGKRATYVAADENCSTSKVVLKKEQTRKPPDSTT